MNKIITYFKTFRKNSLKIGHFINQSEFPKISIFLAFLVFFVLIGIWEWMGRQEVYRFILASPSAIFKRIIDQPNLFIFHSMVTLKEMTGGFFLALLASFPLAWTMYLWMTARTIMQPLFIVFQSIPMFTLAPLMLLWFGWSYMAIIVPTALMIFFPLTLNIYQGLVSTPKGLLDYFKVHQASSWQTFSKLQFPWSLPYIFAGLRISAAFAGIGAIAGEWAGAQYGLGVLMLQGRREIDLEMIFAALFCLIVMTTIFYLAMILIEKRLKKTVLLIFLLILSSLMVPKAGIENPMLEAPQKIRLLLDWFPNSNHIPLYVGMNKQFFAKHKIDLEILQLNDPNDSIPYLTSGQADIALFYMPDAIKAIEKQPSLSLAGVLIGQPLNSFIFRANAGISKPQDLSGRVIGYSVAGSNIKVLKHLLKQNQITPQELRNVNFDLITLLGTGQVDVIYGAFWNIEKNQLDALGISTEHFNVLDLGHPTYSELVFLALGSQDLHSLQSALQESIDYSKAHPQEAFEIYKNFHPMKNASTFTWEEKAWLETIPLLVDSQIIPEEQKMHLQAWLKTLE